MELTSITKNQFSMAGCLRRLFRERYVLKSKNKVWFQKIVDQRSSINQHLLPFLAQLQIEEGLGVAYLSSIDDETEENLGIQLFPTKSLLAFSSLILFFLRHERMKFYTSPNADSIPITNLKPMREFIKHFDDTAMDSRFEKKFKKAVEELRKLQVLVPLQGEEDSFEISSVCDLLLPADEVEQLARKLKEQLGDKSTSPQYLEPKEADT